MFAITSKPTAAPLGARPTGVYTAKDLGTWTVTARARKDFTASDAIRDQLKQAGILTSG